MHVPVRSGRERGVFFYRLLVLYTYAVEILRTIALYVEGKDLPFLVIGGHAVNAYGVSRQTGDLDLLVQRSEKLRWIELTQKLRYKKGQDDDRFARFMPDTLAAWPIDLMFVAADTFSKLYAGAHEVDMGAVRVKVPAVRHLITLKLHALKHYQEHRHAKDYGDVLALLRTGKSGLTMGELEALCLKYADAQLFQRISSDMGEKWGP